MPFSKHNSSAVIQRQPLFDKTRILTLLVRVVTALMIVAVIGVLALSFFLEGWLSLVIAAACMMFGTAIYIAVGWGLDRLTLSLMRRGIRRLLAGARQQHGVDPSAWIIADGGYTILASAKHRRFYVCTGTKWHMLSSSALKQVELVDRRSRLGRTTRWLSLSDEYAGRSIEFRIVAGHPEQLVAALRPSLR
jgi:hypothetical protein